MRHLSLFLSLLLTISMQAQNFKFAQLTDVHLNHDNLEKVEDLLRSIAQINATDGLDFVLITGDISDEGDRYTMEKAKGCFDLLRYPYWVIMRRNGVTADALPLKRFLAMNGLNLNIKESIS